MPAAAGRGERGSLGLGAGHTWADEAGMQLVQGGRRVVLGVGLRQGEAPGVLQPLVRGAERFDQRHELDAGLADMGLEHAFRSS